MTKPKVEEGYPLPKGREPTPREMAADLGLDYDALPETFIPRTLAETLGLASKSRILLNCQKRIIRARKFNPGGAKSYWVIPKDEGLRYAYYRRVGRPPDRIQDRLPPYRRRAGAAR